MTKSGPDRGRRVAAAQQTGEPASSSVPPPGKPVEERDALFGRLTGQMIRLRRQQRRRRVQKRAALLLLVLAALAGYWHAYTPEARTEWKALLAEVQQWTAAQMGLDTAAGDASSAAPDAAATRSTPPSMAAPEQTTPYTAGRPPIPPGNLLESLAPPAARPTPSQPQT